MALYIKIADMNQILEQIRQKIGRTLVLVELNVQNFVRLSQNVTRILVTYSLLQYL